MDKLNIALQKLTTLFTFFKNCFFFTPYSLIFGFVLFLFTVLISDEFFILKASDEKMTSLELYEYTCSISTEFNGGVQYYIYTFRYDQPLSITEVRPYPFICLQLDETVMTYTFDLPMSVKNNALNHNYILYQESYPTKLNNQLKDLYDCGPNDYCIIFEIYGQSQGDFTIQYYLLDRQRNFIKITKQDAEKILGTAQEINLCNASNL